MRLLWLLCVVLGAAIGAALEPAMAAPTPDQVDRAVRDVFPDASARMQSYLSLILKSLPQGETLDVGLGDVTARFTIGADEITVTRWPRVDLPALLSQSGPPVVPAKAKAWLKPGQAPGQRITGPDGGIMVWVPPGEFMMGAEDGDADEKPVHRVRITKGFWLGRCEVTNAQYRAFCEATGGRFPEDSRHRGDDHPAVSMSWVNAQAYCEHYGLTLPTEAQWEYAARGPSGNQYPWGMTWDASKCCNEQNLGEGRPRTFPVGSFPEGDSWCGAADMAGNVSEWCADWYDEAYYAESPEQNPTGPETGEYRVVRGGACGAGSRQCRAADRDTGIPIWGLDQLGFRTCTTP